METFDYIKSVISIILGLSFAKLLVSVKGGDYFLTQTWEYPIRNSVHFLLCIVALFVSNRRFHAVLVILFVLYELTYILRLFNTVN